MKLLVATTNPGKVREFRDMLGRDQFDWSDLSTGAFATVEETGTTFRANAILKATGYARQAQCWALADDSGLEVDALVGSPGVHSARWAEMHKAGKGDADNNRLLLQQLKDVPDEKRTARFVCVLALADPTGRVVTTVRDTVEGRLLHAPRGANGFGYDPLFFFDEFGCTTAELPAEKKHDISHRGKALRRLKQMLNDGLIEMSR